MALDIGLNVNITASLNEAQLVALVTEYFNTTHPQYVVKTVKLEINSGFNDYRDSEPARLKKVNVELEVRK